ncbi:YrdB family protein [Kitasatospora sp. NPDC049258]|uniref:YrdB family protein n=1 Tax=Kitasatospora sp. NPDC049258 TaxID=3155394 RepID=UPI0034165706
MRGALTGTNLTLRFLLELLALVALGIGGYHLDAPLAARIALALALPLAAALLWGRYASPRATVRSAPAWYLTQLLVFGGAVAALALCGYGGWAIALGALMAANTAVLWRLGEWHPSVRR